MEGKALKVSCSMELPHCCRIPPSTQKRKEKKQLMCSFSTTSFRNSLMTLCQATSYTAISALLNLFIIKERETAAMAKSENLINDSAIKQIGFSMGNIKMSCALLFEVSKTYQAIYVL